MNQLKFGRNILFLAILSLLTVMVWIGYEVYQVYTKTTVPQVTSKLIQPLNPTVDLEILQTIKEKQQLSNEELDLSSMPLSSPFLEEKASGLEEEEEEEIEEIIPSQTATESVNLGEE